MKPTIEYPDFAKLDIRVGKIVEANIPEWSNKLIEFSVNFGEEIGTKTILSGLKEWYTPDDFLGNQYLFIVNLAERKMGKGVSQGMMLMVDQDEKPLAMPVGIEANPGDAIA